MAQVIDPTGTLNTSAIETLTATRIQNARLRVAPFLTQTTTTVVWTVTPEATPTEN